jgi:hypothetical protein
VYLLITLWDVVELTKKIDEMFIETAAVVQYKTKKEGQQMKHTVLMKMNKSEEHTPTSTNEPVSQPERYYIKRVP